MLGELKQTGGGVYAFEPDQGETFVDLVNEANAPINERIDATIVNGVVKTYDWPEQRAVYYRSRTDKDIALTFVTSDAKNVKTSIVETLHRHARDIKHAYDLVSHGKWDVTVTPYVIESEQVKGIYQFRWDAEHVEQQMKEQNPEGWDKHVYFCGTGGGSTTLNGIAWLNSNKAWVWALSSLRVFLHEIGHMFGSEHSTNHGQEYGGWCFMAKGNHLINARHRYVIGVMDENYIAETVESGVFFLPPIEVDERDLRNGENSCIRIEANNKRYLVSSRKPREQHYLGVHTRYANSLEIHSPLGSWRAGKSDSITRIPPGEQRVLEGDIEVRHEGWHEGVAKVKVIVDGNDPGDKDYPQPLSPAPGVKIDESFSALWFCADAEQHGVALYIRGNEAMAVLLAHHPEGAHRLDNGFQSPGRQWHVLDGTVKDGYIEFPEGVIRFENADQGLFRFYLPEYGREHLKLRRLSAQRNDHAFNGIWDDGDHQFAISVLGNHIVMYELVPGESTEDWFYTEGVVTQSEPVGLVRYAVQNRFKSRQKGEIKEAGRVQLSRVGDKIEIEHGSNSWVCSKTF